MILNHNKKKDITENNGNQRKIEEINEKAEASA